MSNSSVIDQISRIHFTVKGIKWHPLFLAKLTGFIYRKKDAEAKKAFLIGKIAGAKYSGSKELIKAEKILSDTTKNASILVTHTRQLADRIDAESEQVQRERLKGVYSGNILSLTELRRVLFEAVDILTTRLDRRKYLTQRYLMAFSEKAKYPAENTEKLTNDYIDAERKKLSVYTDLIAEIDKVTAFIPVSSAADKVTLSKEVSNDVL